MGIDEEQIATVIEIARHIRDEASEKLDASFDELSYPTAQEGSDEKEKSNEQSCCSTTASGQSCC